MSLLDDVTEDSGPEILVQLTGTGDPPRSCALLGIARGEMHIRSDIWIEPASPVSAIFSGFTITGEVVYCTRKDAWYRICIAIGFEDDGTRSGPRLRVHKPGVVTALAGKGIESTEGTLLDLSVSGMKLNVSHYIDADTMIFVETESNLVVGEARRCRETADGRFEVGIRVTDILSRVAPVTSRGILKNIRRKFAQAILGEPIPMVRKLT